MDVSVPDDEPPRAGVTGLICCPRHTPRSTSVAPLAGGSSGRPAEVGKTAAQQAIWGGTTGAQYDPCYHIACDTFENVNEHALDVNADAIAFAVLTYAYSTETVSGVPGRSVPGRFDIPEPRGPEGTVS
jgi:hypothetical protein